MIQFESYFINFFALSSKMNYSSKRGPVIVVILTADVMKRMFKSAQSFNTALS